MRGLERHLRGLIASDGPISLARYMDVCLGHPIHGYYMTRDPFGESGDFTTSPEVSQMFGELIGLWIADLWQRCAAPEPARLVELGPGRGTLMADAMRAMAIVPGFLDAADLHLVETSEKLRKEQSKQLEGTWHSGIDQLPGGWTAVVANEFFDALPGHQFLRDAKAGWREIGVTVKDGNQFAPVPMPPSEVFGTIPEDRLDKVPVGGVLEWRPEATAIMSQLSAKIAADGGAMLIIDYGYAGPDIGDSFQAVRRHGYADPYHQPGEADLTMHVDFGELRKAALAAGLTAYGPVDQGPFLIELGIAARAENLKAKSTGSAASAVDTALKRLTSKHEMGSLFKVLAVAAADCPMPEGFASTA